MGSFNEQVYNDLYDKVIAFLSTHNPCKVINGECLRKYKFQCRNFCCGDCEHLTKTGCSAEKPIACKIWLCHQAFNELPSSVRYEYFMLKTEVEKNGFNLFRADLKMIKSHFAYWDRKEREEEE